MVNGPEAAPSTMAAPTIHSLLLATMQTGRSLESSQIQDCNSGKRISHFNRNCNCCTSRAMLQEREEESESYYECEQTGFGRSTALFSSARSRMTSRISPWCATLVWSTHGLVSAFFHVGRQFGASRPNTLACGLRKRPRSFLMGVTIVTPNTDSGGTYLQWRKMQVFEVVPCGSCSNLTNNNQQARQYTRAPVS